MYRGIVERVSDGTKNMKVAAFSAAWRGFSFETALPLSSVEVPRPGRACQCRHTDMAVLAQERRRSISMIGS